MPQIWLTYDEFAALMDCDEAEARLHAATLPLDRRRSRDGRTRVKLNPSLTEAFLDHLARHHLDRQLTACAGDLAAMREKMARPRPDARAFRMAP